MFRKIALIYSVLDNETNQSSVQCLSDFHCLRREWRHFYYYEKSDYCQLLTEFVEMKDSKELKNYWHGCITTEPHRDLPLQFSNFLLSRKQKFETKLNKNIRFITTIFSLMGAREREL